MKLGLGVDVWNLRRPDLPLATIHLADRLGFDSVWSAEIYGADALTPLAWIAQHTRGLRLGTAVMQVAARPPTTAAMHVATLAALAGPGRVICGLGLSGPQIVEGWYGEPWRSPNADLRDYVTIMRQVLRREAPVQHEGASRSLPRPADTQGLGVGKPLKPILHPDPTLPIFLATGGPRNTALTAELADGWLPLGYTPESAATAHAALDEGLTRRDPRLGPLEIQAGCSVEITDDVAAALAARKAQTALLVGGYGTQTHNFHRDAMVRRGYDEAAARITERFLAGDRAGAAAEVPDDYIDEGSLIGPPGRIRTRFRRWLDTRATGLTLRTDDPRALSLLAREAGCTPRRR